MTVPKSVAMIWAFVSGEVVLVCRVLADGAHCEVVVCQPRTIARRTDRVSARAARGGKEGNDGIDLDAELDMMRICLAERRGHGVTVKPTERSGTARPLYAKRNPATAARMDMHRAVGSPFPSSVVQTHTRPP